MQHARTERCAIAVRRASNGDSTNFAIAFDSLRDRHFREEPAHLMANPKAPEEMGYEDLGNFIKAMERSGSDVNKLRTERMLKIAIPFTCMTPLLVKAPAMVSVPVGTAMVPFWVTGTVMLPLPVMMPLALLKICLAELELTIPPPSRLSTPSF